MTDDQMEAEETKQVLEVKQLKGESKARTIARYALMPEMQAAGTIQRAANSHFCGDTLDINALVDEINGQTEQIKKRNLSRAESMLVAQAHSLDQLFNTLAVRAMANMDEYLGASEAFMKLALKAQAQCRNTWESVSSIQNPPLANYAQQLNIAHNQQINNEIPPNQLAGENHELLPDKSNEGATIPIDPSMEALGEVHRAKDATGEA